MAILPKVKKTLIYNEMQPIDQNEMFDLKDKKFLHNIDSLYYVVKVKNDWNKDKGVELLLRVLDNYKGFAMKSNDPYPVFQGGNFDLGEEFLMYGIGSSPYIYDVQKVDKYAMFIMGHQINDKTPEIWVQIRSQYLWLAGEYKAVDESLKDIEKLLKRFDIEIEQVQENRIDFAYHTNYIQDPTNKFKMKDFNRMQQSKFERWSAEGAFRGEFDVEFDYFTLGRKKSNNLFFRIYDKTKEVVEKQYKQFFISIWQKEGLISRFDAYCLEKAFLHPSRHNYKYLDIARLEFYLEYGIDQQRKSQIQDLIKAKNLDYEAIRKLADILVPRVTIILNVEIETKRKFYYSMDNSVDALLPLRSKDVPEYARKLYVKLDNKKVFHNHLTCNNKEQRGVIRFLNMKSKDKDGNPVLKKKDFETSDFWKRLQGTKVNWKFEEEDVKLIREYQKTLDIELMKKRVTNSITTLSVYLHGEDVQNDTYHDALDFMSTLNENDLQRANEYKTKKIALLQNRLGDVENSYKLDKKIHIYDSETGEIAFKSYA